MRPVFFFLQKRDVNVQKNRGKVEWSRFVTVYVGMKKVRDA